MPGIRRVQEVFQSLAFFVCIVLHNLAPDGPLGALGAVFGPYWDAVNGATDSRI